MARKTLTQTSIVDAAIEIASIPGRGAVTGKVLGDELGVDRSAVWRHFQDQDALLRAVGDRLLEMSLEAVPDGLPPDERMTTLARSLVHTFVAHPHIGAAIANRTMQGPGELRVVEFTLEALRESGVPADHLALYQRTLADTILSYAGMCAGKALLSEEIRKRDQQAWMGTYATASSQEYPAISEHVSDLAAVTDEAVLETLLSSLSIAVRAAIDPASKDALHGIN